MKARLRGSAGIRVSMGAVLGAAVGIVFSLFSSRYTIWQSAILVGWDVGVAVLLSSVWFSHLRLTPAETKESALRQDPSLPLSDLMVLTAGVAVLAAVALLLERAGSTTGGTKAYLIALGVLSVALSWALVHTTFTLRYARVYYGVPEGGIDFNEDEPPTYLDFAYLAVTIGMTFQVSDTNLTSKPMRRVALIHALLSYVFGAVIVGLVINVVASLLH